MWERGLSYSVGTCELLLSRDNSPRALSSVEGRFSLDDGLFLNPAATGLAADFGDTVPVVHVEVVPD